jgi:hypothetical protein
LMTLKGSPSYPCRPFGSRGGRRTCRGLGQWGLGPPCAMLHDLGVWYGSLLARSFRPHRRLGRLGLGRQRNRIVLLSLLRRTDERPSFARDGSCYGIWRSAHPDLAPPCVRYVLLAQLETPPTEPDAGIRGPAARPPVRELGLVQTTTVPRTRRAGG